MFNKHMKELTNAEKNRRDTLAEAQRLLYKATCVSTVNADVAAELIKYKESNRNLKVEVDFLKEKFKVSADKLNKEVESNMNLFNSVKMEKESILPDFSKPATD